MGHFVKQNHYFKQGLRTMKTTKPVMMRRKCAFPEQSAGCQEMYPAFATSQNNKTNFITLYFNLLISSLLINIMIIALLIG
jgi:hypothetical protein